MLKISPSIPSEYEIDEIDVVGDLTVSDGRSSFTVKTTYLDSWLEELVNAFDRMQSEPLIDVAIPEDPVPLHLRLDSLGRVVLSRQGQSVLADSCAEFGSALREAANSLLKLFDGLPHSQQNKSLDTIRQYCRRDGTDPPSQMAKVLLVSTYDELFTRANSGAIWGRIYFQFGDDQYFPERGWTDLAVAFVRNWLEAINKISAGLSTNENVHFFDGPFEVALAVTDSGLIELSFLHDATPKLSALESAKDLLNNALAVAQELLARCREKGWSNHDTNALASLIGQGILILNRM